MRAEALSPDTWTLGAERPVAHRENTIPHERVLGGRWDKDRFAEEQVRGLARQVFSAAPKPGVQQVVFCAVEPETDVQGLCSWLGGIVAEERLSEVALVDEREIGVEWASDGGEPPYQTSSVRQLGTRIHHNLWLFPPMRCAASDAWRGSLSAYLNEVRKEFEYSIVAAPAAAVSSKALEIAALTDGVVLVLSARRTRRVTALKVRSALSHVRLLGTVLCDREFPMPISIYRRL